MTLFAAFAMQYRMALIYLFFEYQQFVMIINAVSFMLCIFVSYEGYSSQITCVQSD